MQSDPIEALRSWYNQQPGEIRDTISLFVLVKVPRVTKHDMDILMRPQESFLAYLDEIPDRASAIIGEVLLIRAIVDFAVMRQFGNSDDWEQKKELQEAVAADFEAEHGPNPMTDRIREQLKSFPERLAIWLKTANSWRILKNTSLSDEFLEAWERSKPPRIG